MEAEAPASIAETSRKVHVKFTWGESGLGILEKQMASAGGSPNDGDGGGDMVGAAMLLRKGSI